jgi:hypothetical protein
MCDVSTRRNSTASGWLMHRSAQLGVVRSTEQVVTHTQHRACVQVDSCERKRKEVGVCDNTWVVWPAKRALWPAKRSHSQPTAYHKGLRLWRCARPSSLRPQDHHCTPLRMLEHQAPRRTMSMQNCPDHGVQLLAAPQPRSKSGRVSTGRVPPSVCRVPLQVARSSVLVTCCHGGLIGLRAAAGCAVSRGLTRPV